MAHVYLGIGSNLGDRRKHIDEALSALKEAGITVHKVSSLIETAPVGGPPQGLFLNGAAHIETHLSPEKLLHLLKNIEKKLGRVKTIKNGPRTIDLDILLFENVAVNIAELTIPHPRMKHRDFVLLPLKEIAPDIHAKVIHENI